MAVAGICAYNMGIIQNCRNYVEVMNTKVEGHGTGGIAACSYGGKVRECQNYGTIESQGSNLGGIVGWNREGECSITGCENYGTINASSDVFSCNNAGGILGYTLFSGNISNCYNEGNISINGTGAGGIIGTYKETNMLSVQNCHNIGNVSVGIWSAAGIVGVGNGAVEILQCWNEGNIFGGNGNCGGIVGSMGSNGITSNKSIIHSSVNTGTIRTEGKTSSASCGGILGTIQYDWYVTIENCYNSGTVENISYSIDTNYGVGGILGSIYRTDGNGIATTAKIENCYNRGNIINSYTGSRAGQIVGVDWVRR